MRVRERERGKGEREREEREMCNFYYFIKDFIHLTFIDVELFNIYLETNVHDTHTHTT